MKKKISGCIVIRVSDIDDAYDAFIHFYHQLFDIPVVAVTGTSGKTTTKDMIKHILSTWYK
ncbi:MAG: Mur ligase family protein, partial [Thomasclavelia ramosa]